VIVTRASVSRPLHQDSAWFSTTTTAMTSLPQTPSRRSKRFQPLATPAHRGKTVEAEWEGEPILIRPCNRELDLLPDEQEEREARDIRAVENAEELDDDEESWFYASMKLKKPRTAKAGRGKPPGGETLVLRPGDTIMVETDVLYLQKRPPSIAVIVSMWEVKRRGKETDQHDPLNMKVRVHWFLRPGELPAHREKRETEEVSLILLLSYGTHLLMNETRMKSTTPSVRLTSFCPM